MDVQPAPPPAAESAPEAVVEPALHLLHGWWVASCPSCGFEFAQRRSQERAERAGRRRRCPICPPATEPTTALPSTTRTAAR
jgi:hypothetical protein